MIIVSAIIATLIFSLALFLPNASARTAHVENTTATTTIAPIINKSYSPAFQNGSIVTIITYSNSTCLPSLATIYPNSLEAVNASKVTNCEVGTVTNQTPAIPRWNLIPAFAGLSIYGIQSWGATPQGYPVYNGTSVITQCGASGTLAACSSKTAYFYSSKQGSNERSLGIYNGINGLPEGVLPNPASDKVLPLNKTSKASLSYLVRVSVYDPNIFPNATTGKCKQVAPSNLSNPTGNCLTSLAALRAAILTTDSGIAVVNANNILWQNGGKPMTQVSLLSSLNVSPGVRLNDSNTNLVSYSYANTTPSYPKTTSTTTIAPTTATTAATTVASTVPTTVSGQYGSTGSGSNTALYLGIIVVIIIVVLAIWLMSRKKK